ncbi:uncharacterized protein LOC135846816 [Planococcus citri]|uniref:uncharacterized protein LOC135846816 n=1 Tax=Planococcus citri TaxID=170843 RepID=UPI0031F80801
MDCAVTVFIEEGACETVVADDVVADEVIQAEEVIQGEEVIQADEMIQADEYGQDESSQAQENNENAPQWYLYLLQAEPVKIELPEEKVEQIDAGYECKIENGFKHEPPENIELDNMDPNLYAEFASEVQMEVEQHQGLEMAQVTSKVYDIIHPSPVSLKQLSTIAVSLELWRLKLSKFRTRYGGKLNRNDCYMLKIENTWLKKMLPGLPSTIYQTIEEVSSRFRKSMLSWVKDHATKVFVSFVLNDFDDFVCDYDGFIHYARTAERMMRCEGFSSETKFAVACMYFFEDDVRRIWPSVSANMKLDLIDFDECPAVYYWICRLTNKLNKIPIWEGGTVDERMLGASMVRNRPSVEYFWNRIPLEKRIQALENEDLKYYNFVRFILPKLDDQQLDEYFNHHPDGPDDLYYMFQNLYCDEWIVFRTWFHIRNIITESSFTNLIMCMFKDEKKYDFFQPEKWEYLTCQIWKHTPLNLKQSVIRVISSDSSWIAAIKIRDCGDCDREKINVELLLTILQDASLKERNLFLRNCRSCLKKPLRSKDLQRLMELCCKNQDEINQFMADSGDDSDEDESNEDESDEDESD